jgi:hypothetical protein
MNLAATRMDAWFWTFCVLLESTHVFTLLGYF